MKKAKNARSARFLKINYQKQKKMQKEHYLYVNENNETIMSLLKDLKFIKKTTINYVFKKK